MLPRVDTSLKPVGAIEAPSAITSAGATKQEVASRLDQLVIGKQLQGQILSRQNDGSFLVKLAGASARMVLPQNTKVGDTIPLTLLALTPRPTFLLGGDQGATVTATLPKQVLLEHFFAGPRTENSSQLKPPSELTSSSSDNIETASGKTETISAQKTVAADGKQVSADHGKAIESSAPTILSATGKLINKILDGEQRANSTALIGKTALIQNTDDLLHPEKLAVQLQKIISSSGLFYESHIAQWVAGKIALADLLREPQAQIGKSIVDLNANTLADDDHAGLTQIIRQQLDTLEQQRVVWHGKLLPDIPLQWEITRDHRKAQSDESDEQVDSSWQSTVRFELPQLGTVAATINMHAGHLQLLIRTSADETTKILQENAPGLAEALKQSGTSLESFSVKHDEHA